MHKGRLKVLIASCDAGWRDSCAAALGRKAHEIRTSKAGFTALGLLRRNMYGLILLDDTLPDLGLIEFVLNVHDLAANNPVTMVGGRNVDNLQRVWRHCNVYFAGNKPRVVEKIPEALEEVDESRDILT